MGTSVFIWAVLTLSSYSQTISFSNTLSEERLKEDFIIEHAILNETNRAIIFIRNIGDIEITICSIWVYNKTGLVGNATVNVVVYSQQLAKIDIRISGVTWVSGSAYRVKAVTERGTSYTTTVRAE